MKTTLLFLSVFLSASFFGQQMTYVPDDNFEHDLENPNDLIITWVPDDSVETSILESLTAFGSDFSLIQDYTGLEAAVNLEYLSINQTTGFNLEPLPTLHCPNLTHVELWESGFLGYLDLSHCPNIEYLDIQASTFTGLNVDGLTSLTYIEAYLTSIYELDVSSCSALTTLVIDDNTNLTCLNLANGNNENFIHLTYPIGGNLTCITVDDPTNTNWPMFPNGVPTELPYSLNCGDACSCETITTQQEVTSCDSYFWDGSGQTYSESGQYTENLLSQYGCDSIVTLNLGVISVPEPIIIQNGNTLSCDNFATAYQWLDCDENYAPIEGATDMVFTATQNGSYALEITFNECSDTSECYIIDFVGISELNSTPKQIIKIIDLMGRETTFKPNTPLIYVYDDGSIEKVFSVEY
ncbi:hypothetical protein N8927_04595 [Crocinitomicaceae bacterium]|nr:hypothetical protein [Crocinitomicaceae bacterium]